MGRTRKCSRWSATLATIPQIAASTEGWFGGRLAVPLRVAILVAALCLIHPGTVTDLIGLAIGVPIYL